MPAPDQNPWPPIREIDVALAAAGRTRDVWARHYLLELDLLPEHRQTQEVRRKLFDCVCQQRKSLGGQLVFLDRVPISEAMTDSYQSRLRKAIAAGSTIVGGIYLRESFVCEIPVVAPNEYECIPAWIPSLNFQKAGISDNEQVAISLAVKAYPGWVLEGYGTNIRRFKQALPELVWPYSPSKKPYISIFEVMTDVEPNAFEALRSTILGVLDDPLKPPDDGFYERRLESALLPKETLAKADLVDAVLGPRTFAEVQAGGPYRVPRRAMPHEARQDVVERLAGQRGKQLVRTGTPLISSKTDEDLVLIIGVSTLPINSSKDGPRRNKLLSAATLVHLSFLHPRTGEIQTLNGFEAVCDEAARERVRTKFFPTPRTKDALVLAETREASQHAMAALKAMFPEAFNVVASPLAENDRIIDPIASLENKDAPAFMRALGFAESWPGSTGDFSDTSLDDLENTLFNPQSAKRSQWLARACAWYQGYEDDLVNIAARISTGEPYVEVLR